MEMALSPDGTPNANGDVFTGPNLASGDRFIVSVDPAQPVPPGGFTASFTVRSDVSIVMDKEKEVSCGLCRKKQIVPSTWITQPNWDIQDGMLVPIPEFAKGNLTPICWHCFKDNPTYEVEYGFKLWSKTQVLQSMVGWFEECLKTQRRVDDEKGSSIQGTGGEPDPWYGYRVVERQAPSRETSAGSGASGSTTT